MKNGPTDALAESLVQLGASRDKVACSGAALIAESPQRWVPRDFSRARASRCERRKFGYLSVFAPTERHAKDRVAHHDEATLLTATHTTAASDGRGRPSHHPIILTCENRGL